MNDKRPCLQMRKALLRIKMGITVICRTIVTHRVFETSVILVILANTVALALENPTADEQDSILTLLDSLFLYFYTVEALLKIGALGLVCNKGSYLRDNWNILDFAIVIAGWTERVVNEGVNLNALRTLRILRPLRSISSIDGLRVIITALINSIWQLLISVFLFMFFVCIFSIAGVHLWMGLFKMRCVGINDGSHSDYLCGNKECTELSECGKTLENPNFGATSFDNILYAFIAVFQSITLEGWTDIMIYSQMAFNEIAILFFVPLVFIGAFLLLNFTLAVIKSSFSKAIKSGRDENSEDLNESTISILRALQNDRKSSNSHTIALTPKESSLIEENAVISKILPLNGIITDIQHSKKIIHLPESNQSVNSDQDLIGRSDKSFHNSPRLQLSYRSEGDRIAEESPLFCSDPDRVKIGDSSYSEDIVPPRRMRVPLNAIDPKTCLEISIEQAKDLFGTQKALVDEVIENKLLPQISISILSSGKIKSTSYEDVLPPRDWISQSTKERSHIYEFSYSNSVNPERYEYINDYYEQESPDISEFNYLCIKIPRKHVFSLMLKSGSLTVQQVNAIDTAANSIVGHWSGYDVSPNSIGKYSHISFSVYRIWSRGFMRYIEKARSPFFLVASYKVFSSLMSLAVLLNTIVLAFDRHGISDEMQDTLNTMNDIFTGIFIVEMSIKLLGLGVVEYLRDLMNYIDGSVVIFSIIELIFLSGGKSAVSAFRTIRIFRTFRVLRVARLFRHLRSMSTIITVLSTSIKSFIYLALLLLLFILIFALLGMQIFGGKFDFPEGTPRENFDSFYSAFVTVFQVLSLENWPRVLYHGMRSEVGKGSALYFIFLIYLGNFVILNLFLAILLESFEDSNDNNLGMSQLQDDSTTTQSTKKLKFGEEHIKKQQKETIRRLYEEHEERSVEFNESEMDELEELKRLRSKEHEPSKELFYGVKCGKSFYVFSQENILRKWCYYISVSPKFETTVLGLICVSSVKLAWDTYIIDSPPDSTASLISWGLDMFFTVSFTLELLIKSISSGFILDKKSYLRESWNKLDCFIVVFSLLELAITSLDIPALKVLRLLRTLRPLRFISHNLSMKLVVTALLDSLFAMVNVVIVLIVILLMFAILGVSLFSGKFYTCENESIETQAECEEYGYNWVNADSNFDNVLEALLTLFIISSLEGWPPIMRLAVDAKAPGMAPEKDYNRGAVFYFIGFIFIGAFFMVNFFIGIVFIYFKNAKDNQMSGYTLVLSKEQVLWIEIQKYILQSNPQIEVSRKPEGTIRKYLYMISKNSIFEMTIMVVILLNMIQMAITYDGAPSGYIAVLEIINVIFTGIFFLEALVKIIGLGPRLYFRKN